MVSETHSDFLLWKRFLEGDSNAYSQIYNQTAQGLFQYGLLFTDNRELIKDCIQDVFVKVYINRASLSSTDNIMAYLTVALKNTLFNALKKEPLRLALDEIEEPEDGEGITPETLYINKEKEEQTEITVRSMVSGLTERQREIIYYRFMQEMSIDEISTLTQMNYQSVSNSIQRALGKIRGLFRKR